MSDTTITPEEAVRLRRLLDKIDPDTTPVGVTGAGSLSDPQSFAARHAAAEEAKRLERVAEHERRLREEAAAERQRVAAEQQRREENAPKIAGIDARLAELRSEREPIVTSFEYAVRPIDEEIRALRTEREALS